MPFTIIRDDITRVHADAVVNAANNSLLGGGGVDGAIHNAAGKKLLEECRKLGGCETGSAKITKGYKMPCKYIVHTVGPVWRGGGNNEEELLYSCYKASLELAKQYKCRSIAFPLISAGAYGYPKKQALDVAVNAVREFLADNEMEITLVLFDKEIMKISGNLAEEIKSYIDDVYAEEHYPNVYERQMADLNRTHTRSYAGSMPLEYDSNIKSLSDEIKPVKTKHSVLSSLSNQLKNMDMSFSQKLFALIDERQLKDSQVYKASNISKQVFSKIRSDKKYHPKKITVFAFAVGLRLTMPETEELLRSAGYAFTRSDKTDIIIGYFIERGKYDVFEINEVLFDYDQPLIGG